MGPFALNVKALIPLSHGVSVTEIRHSVLAQALDRNGNFGRRTPSSRRQAAGSVTVGVQSRARFRRAAAASFSGQRRDLGRSIVKGSDCERQPGASL